MRDTLLGKRGRLALIGLGMLAGVLVVLVVYAVVLGAVNATETNERGQSRESQVAANDQTLAIIKDCTQVGGKCYERGQRQTTEILTSAQRIIILSAACSVDIDAAASVEARVQQVTTCVTARLTQPAIRPPKP